MYKIIYTNQAEIDLAEAINFIANESPINALNYLERYDNKIELLQENPYMGINCKSKNINKDCRVLIHESHLIIYQVKENNKKIVLLRIFHGSENYQSKI